jgi:hypothetical protein
MSHFVADETQRINAGILYNATEKKKYGLNDRVLIDGKDPCTYVTEFLTSRNECRVC